VSVGRRVRKSQGEGGYIGPSYGDMAEERRLAVSSEVVWPYEQTKWKQVFSVFGSSD
jgi:hypothetical protein